MKVVYKPNHSAVSLRHHTFKTVTKKRGDFFFVLSLILFVPSNDVHETEICDARLKTQKINYLLS